MATFPQLSSGAMTVGASLSSQAIAMYPSSISRGFGTKVAVFLNDCEQRWTTRGELMRATLRFKQVNGYDLATIRGFFTSQRGMHVDSALLSSFDITLAGVNYRYCVFDQDAMDVTVDSGESYSFELKIRQLRPN